MKVVSLFCGVLGLVMMGCGKSAGPDEYVVQGEVTFDGAPVESGRILFRQLQGSQKGYSGEIKNGSYSLRSGPGQVRVEIVASRPIPGKFDNSNGTPEPVGEMYIPKKYNQSSELVAEVKAEGTNSLPFALTSSKK